MEFIQCIFPPHNFINGHEPKIWVQGWGYEHRQEPHSPIAGLRGGSSVGTVGSAEPTKFWKKTKKILENKIK